MALTTARTAFRSSLSNTLISSASFRTSCGRELCVAGAFCAGTSKPFTRKFTLTSREEAILRALSAGGIEPFVLR